MRVLVTGAAGYLGGHLVSALLADGHEVRALMHRPRPIPEALQPAQWMSGDITDAAAMDGAVEGCDAVVHLATVSMGAAASDPRLALSVNGHGTLNVVEAALKHDAHLVHASTSQVYGRPERLPVHEEAPLRPLSVYAATKAAAEHLVSTYRQTSFLRASVLRVFNAYGPRIDGSLPPLVASSFIQRLLAGQTPEVRPHPEESRDFIHVDDVTRAFLAALSKRSEGTYNVGSGVETTLPQLARLCAEACGVERDPVLAEADGPPMRHQADMTRSGETLGFRAQVALPEGLRRLVDDLRE